MITNIANIKYSPGFNGLFFNDEKVSKSNDDDKTNAEKRIGMSHILTEQ